MAFPPSVGDGIVDGTTNDNKAFWDAYDVEVADALEDTTSGGGAGSAQTPAVTTAEVIDARGNLASIGARIGSVIDPDGAPIGVVSPAMLRNGLVLGNLLANDTLMMWSRGDALAPDFWTLSGAGAVVARCGVGQADTTVIDGQDHFSAKLTYGAAAAVLAQDVVSPAMTGTLGGAFITRYRPLDSGGARLSGYEMDGTVDYYAIGHVRSLTAGIARIGLSDGVQTVYSPYHTADVFPEPFSTLIAGPLQANTKLQVQCRVEGAGSAYFQCLALLAVPAGLPPMYLPARVRYKTLSYYANNPATGVLTYFSFARPAFILGAQMQCLTAGTVTAPTIDLLTPIGGVYSSMFVTAPTIATGQLVGAPQACDPAAANYRRRTIRPALAASATQLDNTSLRLDYVDDGGNTLRDLIVTIHYLEYDRPLDQFRAVTDIGE